MFDIASPVPNEGSSVVEQRLRDWLAASLPLRMELVLPRRAFTVNGPAHGDRATRNLTVSTGSTGSTESTGSAGSVASGAPVAPELELELVEVEPETAGLARLLEAGAAYLAQAREAQRALSGAAAVRARALAAFAAARPAGPLDRPDTEVGAAAAATRAARPAALTPVSEWAVDEVMVALGLSAQAAAALLTESIILVEQLPATLAALEAGTISPAHARMLTEVLAPIADDAIRARVEARVLAGAAGRTVAAVRVAAKRAVLHADAAAAARRLAAAVRNRTVRGFPGRDGMGSLSATMPLPVLRACLGVLEAYAADCAVPGDERTKDQRMVDCLIDLLLRPDAAGRPPVQAQLTLVASVDTMTGGEQAGEVDGQPVPAVLVRELAHTLGLLPRPEPDDDNDGDAPRAADPATEPATGTAPTDATDPATEPADAATGTADEDAEPPDPAGDEVAEVTGLADLLRLRSVAGTALAELPQIALTSEISGQLLALASPAEIRRAATCTRPAFRTGGTPCTHPPAGAGLGPPPPTNGYRPSTLLQRYLRARDRRCRFPGCRIPAARCDLDHNDPYPAGATNCDNLCCLCRHHHRLSHQAPGWTMHRFPDGGLQWTTPSGDTLTTHPPRYGTDDTLRPPPTSRPQLTLRERVLGRPATPEEKWNDPAPF